MSYENISQIEQSFIQGKIGNKMPDEIVVADITYNYHEATTFNWEKVINQSGKSMLVYSVKPSSDNLERLNTLKGDPDDYTAPQTSLVFMWGVTENMSVVPAASRFVPRSRRIHVSSAGLGENVVEGTDIGYEENVVISNINNNRPIKSKIDTGADTCSLHAENIQVSNDTVSFNINGNTYKMPLFDMQQVKQADSKTNSRPSVKLTFQIAGQIISDVECNLNDRSGMTPLLIGKNLLSKSDFSIQTMHQSDNTHMENVDPITEEEWKLFESVFDDVTTPTQSLVTENEVKELVEFMLNSSASMTDVIHHIKETSLNLLNEDISY